MKKIIPFLLYLLTGYGIFLCQGQSGFHITKTFKIASPGGWDYIAVGPRNNRLYVSHSTQVNVLNQETGDSIAVIPNTIGVHGIAFDEAAGSGFTSNGRLNTVTVFDLKTNQVTGQIPAGRNPDAIMYEPFSKTIITCNGGSKDLSVIDPVNQKIITTIPLGGKPETAVSDGTGRVYINIEDKSEIAVVNIKTFAVTDRWPIAPGESASGLAIDKNTRRLFAGCDNKLLVIIDADNGKLIDKLPIGEGCDGVAFDEETKNVFSSNGEGTLTIIHEKSANEFALINNTPTKRGARTIALDPVSHNIYLPTADFESPDPASPKTRPKMIGGTFQILVLKSD